MMFIIIYYLLKGVGHITIWMLDFPNSMYVLSKIGVIMEELRVVITLLINIDLVLSLHRASFYTSSSFLLPSNPLTTMLPPLRRPML